MDLTASIKWMFFGSIIIGIFFNAMNILAYKLHHIYISNTLIYSAIFMASNMCILETIMHYNFNHKFNNYYFMFFLLLSLVSIIFLRKQIFINDNQWLKRMISHHSTALTTSYEILNKTKNKQIKQLATNIIDTQKKEIQLMEQLIK